MKILNFSKNVPGLISCLDFKESWINPSSKPKEISQKSLIVLRLMIIFTLIFPVLTKVATCHITYSSIWLPPLGTRVARVAKVARVARS